MLTLILLVKIKNWAVVEYIKWMLDDKLDNFLSRFESRNYVDCTKVKWALWKDCRRYCKSKAGGKGKTVCSYYGERFDEYFAKLEMEIAATSRDTGCKREWAAIQRLELIYNQDRDMSLEANVSEEEISNVEEQFQLERDSFMARFDFQGAEPSFYRLVLGRHLFYDEVSRALWKKFKEEYGTIACEQNGFKLGL